MEIEQLVNYETVSFKYPFENSTDPIWNTLKQLDLKYIKLKLMDSEEGYGWDESHADNVLTEYLRFLYLCIKYPDTAVVPSTIVDKAWHMHILDTHAYATDCDKLFGKFFHHFPYWGMRGEEDLSDLQSSFCKTLDLYKIEFGDVPDIFWKAAGRCPNCGRR